MANLSFYANVSQAYDMKTGQSGWTAGTSAPGSGDFEVRISTTNCTTRDSVLQLLRSAMRYVESGGGQYGSLQPFPQSSLGDSGT